MPTKEVMEGYLANLRFQKERVPNQFDETMMQLEKILDGEEDVETQMLRTTYYEGWTDDDLRKLMDQANA
jgi:hypothetical protein